MASLEQPKPVRNWKRGALNVFIALHVAAIFLWGLPESLFRSRMVRPLDRYMIFAGLWHNWSMFAPGPLSTHFDVRAKIKYADGTAAEWIAPRMEELSVWQRMPKERYRKWRERIRADEHQAIWDDTARYVARIMNRNPKNPPVEVQLTRHWVDIPPPNKSQDYQPMPKGFTPKNAYTYAIVPIDKKDLP